MKLRQPLICNYSIYDHESSTVNRKHKKYFSWKQDVKKIQAFSNQKKKKSMFSHHEDKKILNLVLTYGPKFKKIAKIVGNRSVSIVKNHYYKELRYKWDQILGKKYGHFNCEKILTQPDIQLIKIEDVKELFDQINFDSCLKQRFRTIFDYIDVLDISKWNFQ
ncbi:hypothetical protein pb186bvf_019194 [Paramecium bursaria]